VHKKTEEITANQVILKENREHSKYQISILVQVCNLNDGGNLKKMVLG